MGWDYGVLVTEVYDLDKPIGSSFGDVEYYRSELAGTEGAILEPAVGTGRILIPLLEAGFTVDGFDVSSDMLSVCRRHCEERELAPRLFHADMTTFARPGQYSAVIVPTGSIALLDGRLATLAALRCFHDSLRPNGRLIIDIDPPRLITGMPAMRHWRLGDDVWTLQVLGADFDPFAFQTTQWLRYDRWHDGSLVTSELQTFRLQQWTITEFTALLNDAGFADIKVTADYQEKPVGAESETWTFHARRQ